MVEVKLLPFQAELKIEPDEFYVPRSYQKLHNLVRDGKKFNLENRELLKERLLRLVGRLREFGHKPDELIDTLQLLDRLDTISPERVEADATHS